MNDVILDPVRELEAAIRAMPEQMSQQQLAELTAHHFCRGLYLRELFIPAGTAIVGKTHKEQNFFLLLSGELVLATPDGPLTVCAPYMAITQPGTKRAVYALTDCVCINVHPNPDDEQDVQMLEDRYITPEALPTPDNMERLT